MDKKERSWEGAGWVVEAEWSVAVPSAPDKVSLEVIRGGTGDWEKAGTWMRTSRFFAGLSVPWVKSGEAKKSRIRTMTFSFIIDSHVPG